jgi:hypothetical protein
MQLTRQCLPGAFAGFKFPAGKFPVPRQWFSGRTLGQQHAAIGLHDNANGYVDDRIVFH